MAKKYKGSLGSVLFEGYPFAFEQLSIGAVATGLTVGNIVVDLVRAIIRFENGPGRYRVDGTVPTTAVGILANDGDAVVLNVNEATNFSLIRVGATNIVANVTYYRITGT